MTQSGPIDFSQHPLVPAVVVDHVSGEVLMIAFMNQEAYRLTRETGRTHYWSRSRNRLWKKGETSGHEQIVRKMAINCEDNALLISVVQIGAVCHTGHPTCFFRDIEEDESLTVTTDRLFDPEIVYGGKIDLTRTWYGAFEWLKSQPLEDQSSTSRLLRTPGAPLSQRVSDELQELSDVLVGTHSHLGLLEDLAIEGTQSLYWLALAAIQAGLTWEEVRPDRALDSAIPGMEIATAARMLAAAAREWKMPDHQVNQQSVHATIALVGQAAKSLEVEPQMLIELDLLEMQARDYLRPWFESIDA